MAFSSHRRRFDAIRKFTNSDHLPANSDRNLTDSDHFPTDSDHLPTDSDHLPTDSDHLPADSDLLLSGSDPLPATSESPGVLCDRERLKVMSVSSAANWMSVRAAGLSATWKSPLPGARVGV